MTNEEKLELLPKFKKANKERRQSLAEKLGFKNAQELLDFLMTNEPKSKKKVSKTIPVINIIDILDCSTSMNWGDKIGAAKLGIREQLESLKKSKNVKYTYTLVTFSYKTHIHTRLDRIPMNAAYLPEIHANGNTALNKAVGETLENYLKLIPKDEKVLVKIYTDGEENDSHGSIYKDEKVLSNKIKEAEERGFTVTFVGTEKDVRDVIKKYKVHTSNTLSYDGTARGLKTSMDAAIGATHTFASKVVKGEDVTKGFYKKTGKL